MKKYPDKTFEEIRQISRAESINLIDELTEKGYNIRKDISGYAEKSKIGNPEEVYAEKFVTEYYKK